jgi:hypothetical protein
MHERTLKRSIQRSLADIRRMYIRALLLHLLLLALPTQAQHIHGPRLGFSAATQSAGGLFQNTSSLLPGVVLGYGMELPLHPQFVVMPELLWLRKGASVRNPAQQTRSRSAYNYLELPILVKVSTDAKPGGLFLTIGPSIGYYVSGSYKQWFNGELKQDFKYDLSQAENRWQFSAAVGMGTDMKRTSFEVRAQTSLTPFSATLQVQNIVYQLTFAWRIVPKPKEKAAEEE